jgi:hypothetical protein
MERGSEMFTSVRKTALAVIALAAVVAIGVAAQNPNPPANKVQAGTP